MAEPSLLVLGDNQDYYVVNTDSDHLQKVVPRILTAGKKEDLLYSLRDESKRVPAADVKIFSGECCLDAIITAGENAVDGLKKLLEKTKKFAGKHNAPYALVQNFDIRDRSSSLYLSAYLVMIE